jgi:hypothetical protein
MMLDLITIFLELHIIFILIILQMIIFSSFFHLNDGPHWLGLKCQSIQICAMDSKEISYQKFDSRSLRTDMFGCVDCTSVPNIVLLLNLLFKFILPLIVVNGSIHHARMSIFCVLFIPLHLIEFTQHATTTLAMKMCH